MSEPKIHEIIMCVIFGLAAGLLCEVLRQATVPAIWAFLKDYRGTLSGLGGGGHGFYWLMPQLLVPGLVLAAPIVFPIEGLFAAPLGGKRPYWVVFVTPLVYAVLAGVMLSIYILVTVSGPGSTSGDFIYMMPRMLLFPFHALSVFGFWLPSIATGLYCHLSRRPRWWLSGLIGLLTLLAGVQFWTLMCVLVGAETD